VDLCFCVVPVPGFNVGSVLALTVREQSLGNFPAMDYRHSLLVKCKQGIIDFHSLAFPYDLLSS
jgi:hypothetical protein